MIQAVATEAQLAEAVDSKEGGNTTLGCKPALWCGTIFALAVLLTVLNFLPPASIYYHVRSQVVVSEARLPLLQANIRRAQSQDSANAVSPVEMRVLDKSVGSEGGNADQTHTIALVEIHSIWGRNCSNAEHQSWIKTLTSADQAKFVSSDLAREFRFASWELELAQRYLERHEFIASKLPVGASSDGRTYELVSHAQVADGAVVDFAVGSQDENTQEALQANLDAKSRAAAESEAAWHEKLEQSHGVVRIASLPQVVPKSTTISTSTVTSILALGVFAGCIAGWYRQRTESGGIHDPSQVANQLALQGLPVVGELKLPLQDGVDWLDKSGKVASQASREMGRNLIRLSETIIAFWLVLIVCRILLDPMWRSMVSESPLVGFARLLIGMP